MTPDEPVPWPGYRPTLFRTVTPGWKAMLERMSDGEWHRRFDLIRTAQKTSDQPYTVYSYVLNRAKQSGVVEAKGIVGRRMYRLPRGDDGRD